MGHGNPPAVERSHRAVRLSPHGHRKTSRPSPTSRARGGRAPRTAPARLRRQGRGATGRRPREKGPRGLPRSRRANSVRARKLFDKPTSVGYRYARFGKNAGRYRALPRKTASWPRTVRATPPRRPTTRMSCARRSGSTSRPATRRNRCSYSRTSPRRSSGTASSARGTCRPTTCASRAGATTPTGNSGTARRPTAPHRSP